MYEECGISTLKWPEIQIFFFYSILQDENRIDQSENQLTQQGDRRKGICKISGDLKFLETLSLRNMKGIDFQL